ncbi:MAG: glutaredoxin 3 [Pseudomonadales bacterium]|nr:glutaredoxin 3 [Pseudomonadales bacterium]
MHPVVMYTTRFCGFCMRAKALLEAKQVPFTEIPVDTDIDKRREMMQRSGRTSVPQIWIGDKHVGGCDELMMLQRQGALDGLLSKGLTDESGTEDRE